MKTISVELNNSCILLDKILEYVEIIDFEKEAYQIAKSALSTNSIKDSDTKEINTDTKKCQLKDAQKYVLIVNHIIEIAEKCGYNICKNEAFFYMYNGCYWINMERDILKDFLGRCAEKMGLNKLDAQQYKVRDMLINQFETSGFKPMRHNNNEIQINLSNGTFVIKDGVYDLRTFKPDDFMRYILPFKYNIKAQCEMFDKFLNRVLPDKECQNILAEYIGWLFIPEMKQEKALFLYGKGANGKSVFFDIIKALLGTDNISSYTMSNLCDDSGYYRAMLVNKLLNYSSEIGGTKINADTMKQIISGEPISCRLPYGKPFIIDGDYAKLAFNANSLPKNIENSHAYFRRFLIIPFTQTIPTEEQDKYLAQKIIDKELSGIFNWVLKGMERLLKNQRFTESKAVQYELEQYKLQSDTVKMFINDEKYYVSDKKTITQKNLYNEYRSYCSDNKYQSLGNKQFGENLKTLGCKSTRSASGMVFGIEKSNIID